MSILVSILIVLTFMKTISSLKNNRLLVQIAVEKFSEATVGYRENREIAEKWVQLFSTPYFMVTAVSAANILVC